MSRRRLSWDERLWRIDGSGCWIWLGPRCGPGYGQFGRNTLAHREAYTRTFGTIPAGLEIHHECETPLCVNPSHLTAVTHTENARRITTRRLGAASDIVSVNRAKTECRHGHPFDQANTYYQAGRRQCRACNRARQLRFKLRAAR